MIRGVILAATVLACGPGAPGGPNMNNRVGGNELPKASSAVVSDEILQREPVANTAQVKHILISWRDLAEAFQGRQDPRGQQRDKARAENDVKVLLAQIKSGGDFEGLMRTHSEDPGSASSARAYTVTPDAQLVIEFRQLALRLNVDEVGVCESELGFHIMKRVE